MSDEQFDIVRVPTDIPTLPPRPPRRPRCTDTVAASGIDPMFLDKSESPNKRSGRRGRSVARKPEPPTNAAAQAILIDSLMTRIDKPLPEHPAIPSAPAPYQPPEFIRAYGGSVSAASSADFHIYRTIRRREMERLEGFEKEKKRDRELEEYEREKQVEKEKFDEQAMKRKAKRQKEKDRKMRRAGDVEESIDESAPESLELKQGMEDKSAVVAHDEVNLEDDEDSKLVSAFTAVSKGPPTGTRETTQMPSKNFRIIDDDDGF